MRDENGKESKVFNARLYESGEENFKVKSIGLEGAFKDGYAGFEADILIIDDIICDDDGELAQKRRQGWRDHFLDSVSTAALRNIRR